jgi:hypothetical protein
VVGTLVNQAYAQSCGDFGDCQDTGPLINIQGTKLVAGYFYFDSGTSTTYRIITTSFSGTPDVVFFGQTLVCTSSPCNYCCL